VKGRRSIYSFSIYIPSGALLITLMNFYLMHQLRMRSNQNKYNQEYRGAVKCLFIILIFLTITSSFALAQNLSDTGRILKKVTVTAEKKQNPYTAIVPIQILNHEALQLINAENIAEASKYFSGVLIKDYGGIGGLKTISVRSLGGLNTGLVYDGITIADAQTGQVDLSKFSTTFVQSLELDQANPPKILAPARVFSSASILSFSSYAFNTINFTQKKWLAGINAGSFGLWQPYAGLYLPMSKSMIVSANAEATWAKGNYPYYINNGMFSQKEYRSNSDVNSFQGEVNTVNMFADSSTLQIKIWGYNSDRGLPGSIIFFNDISVQRLEDKDYFIQSRYLKKISSSTSLLISAKYSSMYTRYTDPNFLNNAGGLDDRYTQNEIYGSIAVSHRMRQYFSFSLASDLASTHLTANINAFATPTRTSLWNNLAVQFNKSHWQLSASLLNTNINDQTVKGKSASNKNEFTPALEAGYKTSPQSPFLFRFFYKNIFRMPTFNDLYYTYNININPKLLPEYSAQYDAGLTYSKNYKSALKQISFSLDGYYNNIKDKIIAVPSQNLFIWIMENLGKVQIKGIDINAEANGKFSSSSGWSGRIAYTWQEALDVTDPSSAQYKNEIPYTPVNSGSALASFNYRSWSAGYSILFSGSRYTLGENDPSNLLPGWNTQDIFISWQISTVDFHAVIKGEVNNIFNEQYDVINYYPMPGRSYKLSVTINNL
jgi:vitamin B12 transporter